MHVCVCVLLEDIVFSILWVRSNIFFENVTALTNQEHVRQRTEIIYEKLGMIVVIAA